MHALSSFQRTSSPAADAWRRTERIADPTLTRVGVFTAPGQQQCVTLGIPPTTAVADPAWGLSAATNTLAAQYVDAYLWFGRPWLYKQADPFVKRRALDLVRSWPYAATPISWAG